MDGINPANILLPAGVGWSDPDLPLTRARQSAGVQAQKWEEEWWARKNALRAAAAAVASAAATASTPAPAPAPAPVPVPSPAPAPPVYSTAGRSYDDPLDLTESDYWVHAEWEWYDEGVV